MTSDARPPEPPTDPADVDPSVPDGEPRAGEQSEPAGPTGVVLGAALLAVAGLALLVVGALHTPHDVVPMPWSTTAARGWCLAAVVLSVIVPLLRHLAAARPGDPDRRIPAVVATLAAAGASFVVAWIGLTGLLRQVSRHFAAPTPVPFLGGGLALGIAMVVLALSRPRQGRRPTTRAVALCWPAAALVLVATLVATTTATGWFVTRTAAEGVTPAPVPASLDGRSWSTPVHGSIRQLIAAGAGVVLSDSNEVEALDGRTGRVRWTYARSGATAIDLVASPDRRLVAFELDRVAHDRDVATQTVVLDAVTGRTRLTYAEPRDPHGLPAPYLTDATLIVGSGLGFDQQTHVFRGISVASGRTAWTYTDPTTCDSDNNPAYAAVPAGLLVAHGCGGPGVTLFDAATGEPTWTVPWRFSTQLTLTPDGRYLAGDTTPPAPSSTAPQASPGRPDPDDDPTRYSLVDTRTGRVALQGTSIRITPAGPIEQQRGSQVIFRDPTTLTPLTIAASQLDDVDDPSGLHKSTRIGGDWYVRLDDSTPVQDAATQISLAAGPYSGATRHVTVSLGGPYRSQAGALGGIVPAPGAVVVYLGAPTVAGHDARVVGLTASAART